MSVRFTLFFIGLIAAFMALVEPAHVWTCDCIPSPPPKEALAKSAAVFQAKVVKIEPDPATPELLRVALQVERWWKGGDSATLTVTTIKSGAACGFGFQPDTKYLVYAYSERGAKDLTVSLCSRTRTLPQAEQSGDLKELGEGKAPAKR